MDISPKIIQKVVFVFHFQTTSNSHIVINMLKKFHHVVKFLLIEILIQMKIQSYFQKTIFFHHEMVLFVIKCF
jgi:hypothetical protein